MRWGGVGYEVDEMYSLCMFASPESPFVAFDT
jgi:hypothetical protein